MTQRAHAGDSHNFGRRVSVGADRVHKPRALLWEWLILSAKSPLRQILDDAADREGIGRDAFGFLPDLAFSSPDAPGGGEVERIALDPLPDLSGEDRRALARIVGRAIALFAWLGISDLHWENLVIGADRGRVIFAPLDVEMILADLPLPTETKLIPDADPEVAAICRHAAGARRVIPYLGKPIEAGDLVAMAGAYRGALALFDRHADAIAEAIAKLPGLREIPIRVCLRGTDEYVRARSSPRSRSAPLWPPLLKAEADQLARGDIPYFFRLYGQPGIHYYADEALSRRETLPRKGDVPQLDPILQISRGLRSPTRKKLREEGMFTVIGAFDHRSLAGHHEAPELAVTFKGRTIVVKFPGGEELEVRRDMRAFVGSVYLPCTCGEVRAVFAPEVTVCDAAG